MTNLRVNKLNSPITRIKMAGSGKGMGTITSITAVNTIPHARGRNPRHTEQLRDDLRRRVSYRILDGAFQVDEYLTTLLDTLDSRGEVIIEQNHVGGFFGHV